MRYYGKKGEDMGAVVAYDMKIVGNLKTKENKDLSYSKSSKITVDKYLEALKSLSSDEMKILNDMVEDND